MLDPLRKALSPAFLAPAFKPQPDLGLTRSAPRRMYTLGKTRGLVIPGLRATYWLALACCGLFASGAALAHHSYAMFDQRSPRLIQGSIAKFEWTNPHTTVWVYARKPGNSREYDLWAFEAASPGLMARYGWRRDSVKSGEKIVIQYFPLRNGRKGGQFIRLFRADGSELIADPHAVGVKPVLDRGRPNLEAFGIRRPAR